MTRTLVNGVHWRDAEALVWRGSRDKRYEGKIFLPTPWMTTQCCPPALGLQPRSPHPPTPSPRLPTVFPRHPTRYPFLPLYLPHVVYDTPSVASHEALSPPIPGQELCLNSSLVPSLRPLEFLPADDPSRGDPSQDEPSREDVVRLDVPVTRSKAKPSKQGESSGDTVVKKTLTKKRNPRKREKRRPTCRRYSVTSGQISAWSILSPTVPSKIQKIVIWYDA